MTFESELKSAIADTLHNLYTLSVSPDEIKLDETKKDFEGDVTLVVFPYTKASKKSPEQTGNEIGELLIANCKLVSAFNVVKGFLNLSISDTFWKDFFVNASGNCKDFINLKKTYSTPGHLMVEYSSPNTNKPLHLGHMRNILLGYSVAEILLAVGHRVEKVNLVNDRGIHICKSMLAWKKYGHGETPKSSHTKGDHLVGKYYVEYDKKFKEEVAHLVHNGISKEDAEKNAPIVKEIQEMLLKWEAGDKETMDLWKMMNGWVYEGFDISYKKLAVDFDKIYYESQTYLLGKKIVEEGVSKGAFFKKDDGSIWIDLTDVGLDQKVLLRADGTSVYITQDLGTASLRFDEFDGLQQLIYVVGNEQEYHFKVLKEIFKKLGRPWADGLFHLSYGMVDLPSGKMKSREGTVVDADDLIKEIDEEAEMTTKALGKLDDFDSEEAKQLYHTIGMGALKYFILKVDPKKKMLFNPAESIDLNGNTGPFIQYTHARIRSVIRKGGFVFGAAVSSGSKQAAASNGQQEANDQHAGNLTADKNVIKVLYRYPAIVKEAAENFSPAVVANYVYEVAKSFNHFYHDNVIVDEADKNTSLYRMQLASLTAEVIKECLRLLGIVAPERM
ncbi:MAG: arginine--tRNA ligase [Bacteroidetes bacterium]|nr:arginine--tRNA ligase [Bacteroidota bacterium]